MAETSAALITGATEGVGRATAFMLGRAGYRIGVCARTAAKVQQVVDALRADGIEAAGVEADVAQADQVARMTDQLAAQLGEIDVLVNTAGVLIAKRFEELTPDDWDTTMATNLRGLFLVTRAVLAAVRSQLTEAEIRAVADQLPPDISELWRGDVILERFETRL